MSYRTTFALLAVLTGLCAAYWWMIHHETTVSDMEFEKGLIFSFGPEELRKVGIQVENERPTIGLTEGDGHWRIEEPHKIEAQDEVWVRVATNLADLYNQRPIETDPKDLAKYELDPPHLTVNATIADGSEHKVIFGKIGPMQVNRYARVDDGDVILVPNKQYDELNRELVDLRQRYLFTVGREGITRLEFARIRQPQADGETPGASDVAVGEEMGVVVVERDANDEWQMLEPFSARANQDLVNKLVSEVQSAAGDDYVDEPENLDDYFLNPPGARITVFTGRDSKPQTAYFGGASKVGDKAKLFVKRADAPAVFQVGVGMITSFPKSPDAFRENRLLTRKAMDLESIEYKAGEVEMALTKKKDQPWRMTRPVEAETDQAAVSDFVSGLLQMRSKSFPSVSYAQAGLREPAISIELKFAEEEAPAVVRVGNPTPDSEGFYATLDTGVITTVSKATFAALTKNVFSFQNKRLFGFNRANAVGVALRLEGVDYRFDKVRQWDVSKPDGKIWDSQDDMAALLDAVAAVDAVAIEMSDPPEDLAEFGLDDPTLTIAVTCAPKAEGEAGETVGPLRVGKPAEENSQERYASVEGRPEVFRIKQELVDQVREALRGVQDR